MSLCLVTGGSGFIGGHIAERLVKDGRDVRILDNLSTGHRKNIEAVYDKVDFVEGDIRDADCVKQAMQDVDTVFHLAALASVPRSVEAPVENNDVNINGTLQLLLGARDANVRRFVYSASSSAYGDSPVLPKREDMAPIPLSPYAVAKLAAEQYCKAFYECYGLQTVSLRYFNVFGPRQDPNSAYAAVIPAFVTRAINNDPPIVYGDGEQTRDFCYIDNVVNANLRGADAKEVRGDVVNIACGESTSLNQIIAKINELLGTSLEADYQPARAGDVKHSLADISAAREVLGYEPGVLFDEGLTLAIEYYRAVAQIA